MLSDKAIKEYKKIVKEEYGQALTDAEAREQGERSIEIFLHTRRVKYKKIK